MSEETIDEQTPAEHWEARYNEGGKERIWSGRVNRTVADVVAGLTPGTALDLGCGEGGDVVWLAQQGWRATGVDISSSATRRGAAAAEAAGVEVNFLATDLTTWRTDERYDLVTAAFFHSKVELERTRILRYAASLVSAGGHLLVVSHAAFPPWAKAADREAHEARAEQAAGHGHDHDFLRPDEEVAALDLPQEQWTPVIVETRSREATGPDGEQAMLDDGVILLRRN